MSFLVIKTLKDNLGNIIILASITLLAYVFSLNNSFVWDDEQFIYNNAFVKNFEVEKIFTQNTIAGAGETSTYYRPLTTLSFAIDHAIWGLNPFGFHLTNTLLHLGAGLLLFFYLRSLKFSKLSSLTISSIFLVHPLQTEAVVYANSRGDSMYAFWAILSILSFAMLLKNKYPKFRIYDLDIIFGKIFLTVITICAYILAILSKEIGIATLGLIGLTYLFIQLQNNNFTFKKLFNNSFGISTIISSLIAAIGYLIFRSQILSISTNQENYFSGTAYGDSIYVRLHTFTQALWTYFSLIFYPYPLHMERSFEVLVNPISLWLIATIALIIILIILGIKEYKKSRTYYIAFGSLWFLSMLVPVSGIIPVNGLIYEHWLYLPIIGFTILIYGLKHLLIDKIYQRKINEVLKSFLPILLIVLIGLTIRQNYIWGDPIRFYNHTLQFSDSGRLHNNLAMAYADIKDYQNAIFQYNKAIESNDSYPQTHHNLANTYVSIGEYDLAKKEFATAIRMNENFLPSYFPLIQIFDQEKSYENIDPLLDKLLEISPDNIEFRYLKAQNQVRQGNVVEGIKSLNEILQTPNLSTQIKIIVTNLIKSYK